MTARRGQQFVAIKKSLRGAAMRSRTVSRDWCAGFSPEKNCDSVVQSAHEAPVQTAADKAANRPPGGRNRTVMPSAPL
jgi:hypothetical protein